MISSHTACFTSFSFSLPLLFVVKYVCPPPAHRSTHTIHFSLSHSFSRFLPQERALSFLINELQQHTTKLGLHDGAEDD